MSSVAPNPVRPAASWVNPAGRWALGVAMTLVVAAGAYQFYQRADASYWKPQGAASLPSATDSRARAIDRLSAQVQQTPTDRAGWIALARAYNALDRPLAAAAAFEKAIALPPADAQLLSEYAFAVVKASDQQFNAKAEQLIRSALALDPDNLNALALAGSLEWSRENADGAITHWERLQRLVPADSKGAMTVASALAQARAKSATGR